MSAPYPSGAASHTTAHATDAPRDDASVGQLMGAVAQSAHTANDEQQQRIVDIVNNARREIYGILGED